MKKRLQEKTRPRSRGLSRLVVISIAVAIAALTCGLVISFSRQRVNARNSQPVEKPSANRDDSKNYITRNVGGQIIRIDPQTGQVQPLTPEEAQRLAEGLKELANQSTEGLKQVQHADGSVSMDLEGRFQNVAVARKEADGTVAEACIDNPQAGAAFFRIDPKLVAPVAKSGAVPTSKSPSK